MKDKPESLEDLYDSYKRVYPWYRGPDRIKRIIGWVDADGCIPVLQDLG
jgi:hypothetical protein